MKSIIDYFSSVKLTLLLLLGLSLIAIGGTIWPVEQGQIQRFDLYFQSVWFRCLLGLLVLNLTACTWKTWIKVAGEKSRLLNVLDNSKSANINAHELRGKGLGEIEPRLRQQGYRVDLSEDKILARSGLWGRWALPILHLSILAVMLGGWASELGFVGTMNIYVTHQSDKYFDWEAQGELPLDFTFRLDHFEPRYYPIDLRFATYDKQTRELIQEFTTTEGETVELSPGLSVQVLRFFPEEQHLVLGVIRDGLFLGEYHTLSGKRSYPNSIDLGFVIKPTAFRDPILKQMHSQVSIIENGELVRQGVIEVNTPIVHRGVAIYQTAYARDESGFWTCGFQLSKDPGEPVVWIGSILLTLALVLVFMVRFRALGVVIVDGECRLVALAGFRGDVGKQKLDELISSLGR
jgi:cytochrome c biogenesis protein